MCGTINGRTSIENEIRSVANDLILGVSNKINPSLMGLLSDLPMNSIILRSCYLKIIQRKVKETCAMFGDFHGTVETLLMGSRTPPPLSLFFSF